MTHFFNFNARNHISGMAEESRQILYAGRKYQVLAFRWQTTHPNRRCQGHVTRFFLNFAPIITLEMAKLSTTRMIYFLQKACRPIDTRDLFKFWEITDISLTCYVAMGGHHCQCPWRSILLFEAFLTPISRQK